MATETLTTTPCPQCGHETYTKDDDDMVYCTESDKPVLVCDALPMWVEDAHAAGIEGMKRQGMEVPKDAEPANPNAVPAAPAA